MVDSESSKESGLRDYYSERERQSLRVDVEHTPSFSTTVRDITIELGTLLIKKHSDYGSKNISQSPGGALNGLRVRMWDKLARINNLVDKQREPHYESLEDSFVDMANYAIIGLMVLRKQWDNE